MPKSLSKEELMAALREKSAALDLASKELSIESSLDKVMTCAMAMKEPAAMLDICKTISLQLQSLGVKEIRNVQTAIFYESKGTYMNYEFYAKHKKTIITETLYTDHKIAKAFASKMLKGRGETYITHIKGVEVKEWLAYQKTTNVFIDKYLNTASSLSYYWHSLGPVALGISTYTPLSKEELELFQRFLKVFELAYRRYLDIEKANAQTREAQIEAALERVRSRSMAMHDSSEIGKVIVSVYTELTKLDARLDRCFFMIVNPENLGINWWMAGEEGLLDENGFFVQYNEHPSHLMYLDHWKKRRKKWHYLFQGKEKRDWDRFGFTKTELARLPEPIKKYMAGAKKVYLSGSSDAFGLLVTGSFEPLSEEHQDIISRFTTVFNQTYTRFNDLKKAEAQAREAQVEAALERVRSQSMAMHKSQELIQVVGGLDKEIKGLGIEINGTQIVTDFNNLEEGVYSWFTTEGEDYLEKFHVPLFEHTLNKRISEAIQAGVDFYMDSYSGAEKNEYFKLLFKNSDFRTIPKEKQDLAYSIPIFIRATVLSKNSVLIFQRYFPKEFSEEEGDIFKRFGKVFEQAYTRFLDLQKAEAQAREAQIEAALEKVRSRSLAMHKTDELKEVIAVVFEKLKQLNFNMDSRAAIINIYTEGSKEFTEWITDPGQTYPTSFRIPEIPYDALSHVWKAREKGEDFSSRVIYKEEKNSFFNYLFRNTGYQYLPEEIKKSMLETEYYTYSIALGKNSGISLPDLSGKFLTESEIDILKRFAKVFDQAYTRFLDLQKAEAQAREAQIEASLERVRSKTMAMHNSHDVGKTVATMFDELVNLGIDKSVRCGVGIFDDSKFMEVWTASSNSDGEVILNIGRLDMTIHPLGQNVKKAWDNKEPGYTYELSGEDLKNYFTGINTQTDYTLKFDLEKLPERVINNSFRFPEGLIYAFTTTSLSEEMAGVFKRFAGVFGQTYRRYLDLIKAEAQAREAQIEVSLERVRSKAMAMHNSSDLPVTAIIAFSELKKLGFVPIRGGISIQNKENRKNLLYSATSSAQGDNLSIVGWAMLDNHPVLSEIYNQWMKGEDYFPELRGDLLKSYYEQVRNSFSVPLEQTEVEQFGYFIYFTHGVFYGWCVKPVLDDDKKLLRRFASVIDLTFKRYFDLQKSEAQAREAQIEAALERVRSRSMAMHKSEELADLSLELVKQVQALGVATWFCAFNIYDNGPNSSLEWGSNGKGVFSKYRTPREGIFLRYYEAGQRGETLLVNEIGEDECPAHYEYLCSLPGVGDQLLQMKEAGIPFPKYQIDHVAFFKQGYLIFITYEPVPETHDIFKRFARVFEQSYTRFLDLKNAEAQAREAQIEAALEKVRSRSLAMQKPEELVQVAELLRNEMGQLGVEELETSSIYIVDKEKMQAECWYAIKGIREGNTKLISDEMTITFADTWVGNEMGKFYRTKREQVSIVMKGDNRKEWINYCAGKSKVLEGYYGDEIPERIYHLVKFNGGYLGAASPGDISAESWDLLRRAASVFSLAYTRFNDLQIAEAHALQAEQDLIAIKEAKQKAEEALTELQATQKQLIQAEKMASLGELTAGIAHEIQNPLNFVNNFSELSNELIDELQEEMNKGNNNEVKNIISDIRNNLEKINHHGKRADAIVKGMLQHSRVSGGEKKPTDINALADEYLRLAYHGLRAKDKNFNATLKTDFDNSIGKINIIPQDMGRVLLNLMINAFYAISEKQKLKIAGYEPSVNVSTKKMKDKVQIEVRDNGIGIPENITGKIFQPFFTTKPTGQGTGLGLSLAYDIVTKGHNGEMGVMSNATGETIFYVTLPT